MTSPWMEAPVSRRGALIAAAAPLVLLAGCAESTPDADGSAAGSAAGAAAAPAFRDTDLGCGWEPVGALELEHARTFTVDYFDGGFALICAASDERFLVVPDGASAPDGLAEDIAVIAQPADDVYLVSTGMICVLDELDALDAVRVASVTPETSPNEHLTQLIEDGEVVYGGRYRDPDFELVAQTGCTLAIENTQIHRYPEVKQKLEDLGVTVFTEQSSTEDDVLGRLKLMGVIFACKDAASARFDEVAERVDAIAHQEPTGKTVAFFYIDSDGAAVVRRAGDYFAQMIELAGGESLSFGTGDGDASSTTYITVEMEEFFASAKDSDVIIYNATVDEGVGSLADLTAKNALISEFAAVATGEVYTCDSNLYQQMTSTDRIIEDLRAALLGASGENGFIWKLG